jgi:structural maintenance of chromosomes protein 5
LQDRDVILQEIEKVKTKIVIAQYLKDASEYTVEKTKVRTLSKEYHQASEYLGPLKAELTQTTEARDSAAENEKECFERCKKTALKLGELSSAIEQYENQHLNIRTLIISKKKEASQREQIIQSKKLELEAAREKEDQKANKLIEMGIMDANGSFCDCSTRLQEIAKHIAEFNDKISDTVREINSLSDQRKELARKMNRCESSKQCKLTELDNLDNIRQQKYNLLKRDHPALEKIMRLLSENRNKFRGRVYDPVLLELSIKDSSFANLVEGTMNFNMLTTFVCECEEDYYAFKKLIIDQHKMRANVSCPDVQFSTLKQKLQTEKVILFHPGSQIWFRMPRY